MKRLLSAVLTLMILSLSVLCVRAEEAPTSARAFVLYCPDNGRILLSENPDLQLPMASTTKIMTTLLTLEAAAENNRAVEFTEAMTAEGSSMYLKRGEKVTLRDLAVGMMMQSGNDAANAAALTLSGSMEAFAAKMNEKARAIGMKHTHFVTPSGLDDDAHYSCASDMALLMAAALQNEDFAAITSQTSMEVRFIYPADKFITYPNHNKLLRMDERCIGGKTGYTDAAGRCLVTAARKDGMTLIAVTLDDRDDWDDHIALYDYGFGHYSRETFRPDERTIDVVGGDSDTLRLTAQDVSAILPTDHGDIQTRVMLPAFLYAPVKKGECIGKTLYLLDGKIVAQAPLIASRDIGSQQQKRSLFKMIKELFNWHS